MRSRGWAWRAQSKTRCEQERLPQGGPSFEPDMFHDMFLVGALDSRSTKSPPVQPVHFGKCNVTFTGPKFSEYIRLERENRIFKIYNAQIKFINYKNTTYAKFIMRRTMLRT